MSCQKNYQTIFISQYKGNACHLVKCIKRKKPQQQQQQQQKDPDPFQIQFHF